MMVSNFAAENADEVIKIEKTGFPPEEASIYCRPHLFDFLNDMEAKFELIIYSSFGIAYVKALVARLERDKKYFQYIFGDEFCLFANVFSCVKCIDFLFHNRSPEDIIMVDTQYTSLPLSKDNLIPILPYDRVNKQDTELAKLSCLLDALVGEKDVREGIQKFRGVE